MFLVSGEIIIIIIKESPVRNAILVPMPRSVRHRVSVSITMLV